MASITSTEAGASGRYINLGSPASQDDVGAQTIIVYAKPTAAGGGNAGYLLGKTPSASASGLRFWIDHNSGNPRLGFGQHSSGSATNPAVNGLSASVTYGNWAHFEATWDGGIQASGIHVYVNGTEGTKEYNVDGSGTIVSDAANDLFLLNRGNSATLGRQFVGDVAYIARWNRVLDATERATVRSSGPLAVSSGLILLWANDQDYSANTITPTGRSTRVTGSTPPNTALGGETAVSPSAGSIAITGYAPTVLNSGAVTLSPSTGSIVVSGYVPTITAGINCPTVTASNVHVVNLQTGATLYSKGTKAHEDIPASLTKLLTAYVVLRNRPTLASLQETTTVTSADITDGTTYNLVAGDAITLHALLGNMLLPSDNASASALARVIGLGLLGGSGTEAQAKTRFVSEMNTQAAALGMGDSTFYDYHGLSTNNTTTPADINKVTAVLVRNRIVRDIWRFTTFRFSVTRSGSPTALTAVASNDLDGRIGIVGGKTGTLSMYNLSVLWEAPNGHMIATTIMGDTSDANRYTSMSTLLAALPGDYPALATPGMPFVPSYLFETLGLNGAWFDAADPAHMWQDAAGTTPVTGSGQAVGKWAPKAGNASLYWRQATSGARPAYNSASGMVFDGANDYLDLGAGAFGAASLFVDESERFMVIQKFASTGATGTLIAKAGATTTSRTFHSYVDSTTGAEPGLFLRGGQTYADANLADGSQHSVNVWWDGSNGGLGYVELGTKGATLGAAAEESQNILLGSRTGGTAAFLNGSVQHVVLVDSYDADAFRRLRDWSNGASINAFGYSSGLIDEGNEVSPQTGTVAMSGYAPSIVVGAAQVVEPASGAIGISGYAPAIQQPRTIFPAMGSIIVSGGVPSVISGAGIVWPNESDVRLGVTYGPTGTEYTGTMTGGSGPSAEQIAAAVLAALQSTTIPVNVTHFNGNLTQGSGTPADPVRPA